MSAPPPPARRWSRRLAAAALSVLVTLALAEGALRTVEGRSYEHVRTEYGFVRIPPGLLAFPPGGRVTFQWDGDPYGVLPPGARLEVALNAAGLRGPLPPPGQRPVLFVGDSFTFGEGVAEEDTFVGRLRAAADGRYFPVNAGVPGYGTPEEAARLDEWVANLRPRAVVLVFGLNDVIPLADSLERGADLLHVRRREGGLRLLALLHRARADDATEAWYRAYYTGDRKGHWEHARETLAALHGSLAARGIPFGVAVFPLLHELDTAPFADLHALVTGACRERGVPVLDLLPAFRGTQASTWWVHPADHHPNRRAHELAAQELLPFVDDLLGR